jgi:hypothetical protein
MEIERLYDLRLAKREYELEDEPNLIIVWVGA